MISILKKKIQRIKDKLDKKALRMPKTKSQKLVRTNWERVRSIWEKRYGGEE